MATTATKTADERMAKTGVLTRLLRRPELGALTGAIVVWVFFAVVAPQAWFSLRGTATYLEVAANLGIVAVPVAMLMIGGEFDLSVGSIVGLTGAIMAILASVLGVPLWLGAIVALGVALGGVAVQTVGQRHHHPRLPQQPQTELCLRQVAASRWAIAPADASEGQSLQILHSDPCGDFQIRKSSHAF